MGLFDLFKKKTSARSTSTIPKFDPWENKQLPRNDEYAIAAFIQFSKSGAEIGKTKDDYPRYINYEYKVNDPIKYHRNVIAEGYLVEAEPAIALKSFKVDQLKAILVRNGLPDKGKKEDLIARICESVDVSSLGLETYYIPSEKGLEHLRKYDYVFNLRKYGLSWEQFDEHRKKFTTPMSANDVIWGMLQSRYMEYAKENLYGFMRNECYHMATLLKDEKRYKEALKQYIRVLNYDTSGCGNGTHIEKVDSVAPGLVRDIFDLKEYYDDSMLNRIDALPHHHISRNNFKKLLDDIFADKVIDVQKYMK